jgi:hypothetical protein
MNKEGALTSINHKILSGGRIAAGVLGLAVLLQAAVELRGRALFPSPSGPTVAVTVKVTIKSFSTPEEVEKIRSLIAAGDAAAVNAALKSMDKAMLQYIGGGGTNTKYGLAVEIPTEKGSRILLVTYARSVPGYTSTEFSVAEFRLVTGADGEGRLHETATINFPSPGSFDLDRFFGEPLQIVNVRRTK